MVLDVLVVALAVASAVGTGLRTDAYRPSGIRLGLEIAAIALMVLTLLLRHRAPFAAPASTWLFGAALSFVDGRLIVGQAGVTIAGLIAAVLLGNLPGRRQAMAGLVVVVASAAVIAYNDPTHAVADKYLIPSRCSRSAGWSGSPSTSAPRRSRRPRNEPPEPNESARSPRGSPWPRSGSGSPGSCTTSWPTR